MKVSLRFLLMIMFFGLTGFVSSNCSLTHGAVSNVGDYVDSAMLADGDGAQGDGDESDSDGDESDGDQEEPQGRIRLNNQTGVEFFVRIYNPNGTLAGPDVTVPFSAWVTILGGRDFFINTEIPTRTSSRPGFPDLASFRIPDGSLHPGAVYAVELLSQINGRTLRDADGTPIWIMRFTEVAPANGQAPHVFDIVRPQ